MGWADGGNGRASKMVILHNEKPRDIVRLMK